MLWEFRAGLISTLKGKVGLSAERSSTSIDRLTTFPENVTCLFLEKAHTQMGSSFFTCIHCRAEKAQWHPTPVFLPGKSHGRRSLVGCSPWGHRVGHDWATSLSLFTFVHWRRKWQPTPVFLPGESQGRGSLVGCRLGVAQNLTRLKRLSSSSSSHCRESIADIHVLSLCLWHDLTQNCAFRNVLLGRSNKLCSLRSVTTWDHGDSRNCFHF